MSIYDDFSIAVNGDIRHDGTSLITYTVLEFHRMLQNLADNASTTGNDLIDITSSTPSARATDNIITLNSPYNIDDDAAQYLYNGSIEQDGGNTLYSGLVVVGSIAGATTLQVVQNNALYDGDAPFWGTGLNVDEAANILSRMLIKTKTGGNDIDNKKIRVYAREWGNTYAEFEVTMGLGNSVAAIFTSTDLNNTTVVTTVATWNTITNLEGYQLIDLLNGSGPRPYYSQWDRAAYTINQLYERAKWLTRRGSTSVVYGMDGELFRGITHQWDYDNEQNGPFMENDVISWGTGATAGTGALLALLDSGVTGTMWIQLLTGVPPTNNMEVTDSTAIATCDVNGTVTSRSVSPVFLGQSTGSAIIGGFGVGVQASDLTKNDKVFDLIGVQQTPPNLVTFTVYGLVSGQDRVLVTNSQASTIDWSQMTLNTALTAINETAVDVGTGNIPADTPQTGNLRIELDSGIYRLVPYLSHNSDDVFTIAATDFSGDEAAATNNVFISYIDKLADAATAIFQVVYALDRTLFVRVRDGGATPIKTFETTAGLSDAGGSATANRTSDV